MTANFYQGLISYNRQIIIDYEKNRVLSSLRPKFIIGYGAEIFLSETVTFSFQQIQKKNQLFDMLSALFGVL